MIAAIAAFVVWLGFVAEAGHRQARSVTAIETLGGSVSYADVADSAGGLSDWLARRLGKEFIRGVTAVYLAGRPIDDSDLDCLADLPALETINLASTRLSDAGLERLKGLRRLRSVDVRFTRVTEDGVRRLREALPHAKVYRVSDIE
jgi:hypothetical protein